jgi:hypothetical protein
MVSEPIVESRVSLREDKVYLPEAKKRFPHLSESFLLENKALMENINFFKVTVKEIQKAYPGLKFAEARALQKEFIQFAILEHHARNTPDETFLESANKSIQVILEREPFYGDETLDPNSPEAKKWAANMAALKGKGVNDTVGPKMDMSSGEEAPKPEKKKGFFSGLKDKAKAVVGLKKYLKNAAKFVVEVAKSKETHKALAIGAALVLISILPGGTVLLPIAKGLLGAYGIFKGSKSTLDQAKKLSGGKKGIEGVKEYFKNIANVKEGARIIGQLAQIGLGAWGSSSAIGDVLQQVKVAAAEQMYNPDGAPATAPAPEAPAAPAAAPASEAPAAPAAPEAPAVAPSTTPSQFMQKMHGLVGDNYEQYLENPEKYNDKIFGHLSKMGVNLDGPASEVFKNAQGNMSARDYIESALDGIAKAKQMAAIASR